jgi:UDP-2-acetamido-3-amino-2,3-dideoxy-glucuronate N-acetyltransferase
MGSFVHPTADIDEGVIIKNESKVWHLAHLRQGCVIGENCVIGRGVFVDLDVKVGDRTKIQNYSLIYSPAVIENDVFIGPAVVFTNDKHPRSSNIDGQAKSTDDWQKVGVTVRRGASIGARSVCVAPVEIGEYALVGAGAVVTKDVPAFALVVGNPARQIGWVDHAGVPLVETSLNTYFSDGLKCEYKLSDGQLVRC